MFSDLFVSYLCSAFAERRSFGNVASEREAVSRHLGQRRRLAGKVIESAHNPQKPCLRTALSLCRRHGATPLIAELGALGGC